MVRTKVFVGNLSFATKENELAKEFEVAGKVISANIITRGPRSLGYGFVELDNEADAENAVKLLNKKEIDGRPINVEVAKPREEGAEGAENKAQNNQQGGATRGRGGRGGRGGFRGTRGGNNNNTNFGGNRRFRRRDGGSDDEADQQQQQPGSRGGFRGGRGRGRGGRGGNNGQPRQPRNDQEKREDTRTPSQTTLFVANLPFSLDDEGFAKLFKDSALAFKAAHVVKKRSGRSKGFGFVEFENEADQQKALAAIDKKQVEGRELVVKVALTEQVAEAQANQAADNTANTNATAEKK